MRTAHEGELDDYRRWLDAYVGNWLGYVGDTCSRVDTGEELPRRRGAQVMAEATEQPPAR